MRFFRTAAGTEPVRDWLRSLPAPERKRIGQEVRAVQFAWPIGMPLVRKLDKDLWEVRVLLANRAARVFFTVIGDVAVLLHGIVKKSQRTPAVDLQLAKRRRDQVSGAK